MEVEQIAFGGKGLIRLPNGKVCFVPWVIPGEKVEFSITKERSSFAEAQLRAVLEPSADRVSPPCPVFQRCGGCQYQHIAYERQLVIKQDQVRDVLKRLAGLAEPEVAPTLASPKPYGYRNRVTVHVDRGRLGFFAPASRKVVEIRQCPIASETVNAQLTELRQSHPEDGQYPLREPSTFRGFRQVNDAAAAVLLETVGQAMPENGGLLVDAYSGAGFFARALSDRFERVIGIEWSGDAVRAAKEAAGPKETYLLGDVNFHLAEALDAAPAEQTTVLLDPPAEGIDAEVGEQLLRRQPIAIVYVSCNPATLARDLRRLKDRYDLIRATPVDMFPQTSEIEVVAVLGRRA